MATNCQSLSINTNTNLTSSHHKEIYTPTNEASRTTPSYPSNNISIDGLKIESDDLNLSKLNYDLPWLPVSKGNIKKLAHTRFVNSSPKSYRLMPASEESNETDRTSFVEKSSHKFVLPVSYFLEVAKLWEVSNRSELECRFTLAGNYEELKTTPSSQKDNKNSRLFKKSIPISHTKSLPAKRNCPWTNSDKPSKNTTLKAEQELLLNVNRFLKSCQERDSNPAALSSTEADVTTENKVGSETCRYLSQIVSLMSKKFAFKLVNQHHGVKSIEQPSDKYSHKEDDCKLSTERPPRVNVFTMTDEAQNNEQLVIIHIPKTNDNNIKDRKVNTTQHPADEEPNIKRRRSSESSENTQKSSLRGEEMNICDKSTHEHESRTLSHSDEYTCFYCDLSFSEQFDCARHMLTHLASSIKC